MPNLIFKVDNYKNEGVIKNLVNYIMSSAYYEVYGENGCFLNPNQNVAEGISNSFNAVKNVRYKNNGQLVQHIIIGFGDIESVTEYEACEVAARISNYFFLKGYQTFWGGHFGSDTQKSYRHIHMIVNTINGMTGLRYSATYENMSALKEFMKKQYPNYSWNYYESPSHYQEGN